MYIEWRAVGGENREATKRGVRRGMERLKVIGGYRSRDEVWID